MQIHIALSRDLSGRKVDMKKNAGKLTYQYTVEALKPSEIIQELKKPVAITNIFENEKGQFHRAKKHFKYADWFALDFDNDHGGKMFTIDEALADPFISSNALFLYTTPSHSPEKHKFRIFFLFPSRVKTAKAFEDIVKPITDMYRDKGIDNACWNVSRFYFGAGENAQIIPIKKRLKLDSIMRVQNQAKRSEKPKPKMRIERTGGITDKQKAELDRLLGECATAQKGDPAGGRSAKDFSYMCFAIKCGLSKMEIESECHNIGKFATDGKDYFELTYSRALEAVQDEPEYHYPRQRQKMPKPPTEQEASTPDRLTPRARYIIDMCFEKDRGLTTIFAELMKNKALYNYRSKHWMLYDGKKWINDDAKKAVKIGIEKLLIELKQTRELCRTLAMSDKIEQEQRDKYQNYAKMIRKRIDHINVSSGFFAIERIAQIWMPVDETDFDSNPYLFNMANGTFDLEKMKFRKHNPEDLCRLITETPYDPDKDCPEFRAFLDKITDDKYARDYLLQNFGLGLTGISPDQLAFLIGKGANGKSTLLTAAREVYGDYATAIRAELFIKAKFGSRSSDEFHLCKFRGARFVIVSELEAGYADTGMIKEIAGGSGEKIAARQPAGRPFEFEPTHNLIFTTNSPPRFQLDGTHGLRRRINFVEFNYKFEGDEKRPKEVINEIYKNERSGIFNLFLEGWKLYQEAGGFIKAPSVTAKTESILIEDDTIDMFIRDQLEKVEGATTETREVFSRFKSYCEDNEFYCPFQDQRSLNKALRDRGLTSKNGNPRTVWEDIKMKPKEWGY